MITKLKMKRGDTPSWKIAVTDSNGATDLTGTTMEFTARSSTDHVINRETGNGITVDDADGGLATLTIIDTDTVDFPDYVLSMDWDLRLMRGSEIHTVASGTLLVTPDVRES
jgi:hypothetical protein